MDTTKKNTLEILVKKFHNELKEWASVNLTEGQYVEVHVSSYERNYETPKEYATQYPSVFLRDDSRIVAKGSNDPNPFMQNAFFNSFRIMWFLRHPFTPIRIQVYRTEDRYQIVAFQQPEQII